MTSLPHTQAWRDLEGHVKEAEKLNIAALLETEKDRLDRMTLMLDDVLVDFSKHLASARTCELLAALAKQQKVADWFRRMMHGEKINVTENRAVLHTALRASEPVPQVKQVLMQMKVLSEKLRADRTVKHVVHIGIGGSDLGPRLVYQALKGLHKGPQMYFVANVDPDDLDPVLAQLNPQETIVTVASKTFTTQETLLNFQAAKAWVGIDRMIALTVNVDAAKAQGFADAHILAFWDWVGGRFSMWSAVGFPVALAFGFDVFQDFLRGGARADRHVEETAIEENIPILMALFSVWYRNFLGGNAQAILPYAQRLEFLPAYMQQLVMESNGKGVDREGNICAYATAPVIFGQAGTNGQHAFYQMLHQGPEMIPCDFIGVRKPSGDPARHRVLMANMLAQSQALMMGRKGEPAKACPGNRPSTCIILPQLDAYHLGLLLALYEHKTAAEGFLWNINSFDQFGVELGKALAKELLAREGVLTQNEPLDKSTNKLIFHTFLGK